jgi:hypothetical protein
MKKSWIENKRKKSVTVTDFNDQNIFEGLELAQRTQLPPSEEKIIRLNEIASKPPFSYIYKAKENQLR